MRFRFTPGQVVKVKNVRDEYFRVDHRWMEGDNVKDTRCMYQLIGAVNLSTIDKKYCGGVDQKYILPLSKRECGR